jgi:hypothetical protein
MPDTNRISAALSAGDLTALSTAIATIKKTLPFLVSLSPGESRELPKLGPKTLGFDERCASYMDKEPSLVPAFIDLAEVAKDRALRAQLAEVVRDLSSVSSSAEDTLAIVSHEIYSADLAFYQNVRQAAKRGILNAQTIYEDLSTRFPGRPSAAATKPTKTLVGASA